MAIIKVLILSQAVLILYRRNFECWSATFHQWDNDPNMWTVWAVGHHRLSQFNPVLPPSPQFPVWGKGQWDEKGSVCPHLCWCCRDSYYDGLLYVSCTPVTFLQYYPSAVTWFSLTTWFMMADWCHSVSEAFLFPSAKGISYLLHVNFTFPLTGLKQSYFVFYI